MTGKKRFSKQRTFTTRAVNEAMIPRTRNPFTAPMNRWLPVSYRKSETVQSHTRTAIGFLRHVILETISYSGLPGRLIFRCWLNASST